MQVEEKERVGKEEDGGLVLVVTQGTAARLWHVHHTTSEKEDALGRFRQEDYSPREEFTRLKRPALVGGS